ncbi:MAG: hypothetical protein ACI9Y1_002957 [Lentisphaeria bacterium]|jgi:hypothetical protein
MSFRLIGRDPASPTSQAYYTVVNQGDVLEATFASDRPTLDEDPPKSDDSELKAEGI